MSRVLLAVLLTALPSLASAQTVLSGDHSVTGNLCVGVGCTGTQTFPDGPLKLKQNNVRILFEDDSSVGSFPSRDWVLEANGAGSGGDDYFAIVDAQTGNRIFRVDADAPANALYVAGTGFVGVGTMLPEADLHLASSYTSKLRMREASSSADWEVNVGVTGISLMDQNIDSFPFLIENGAPNYAFWVNTTGSVGMGTFSPAAPLHVLRSDGTAKILVQNGSGSPAGVREMFKMTNYGGSYFTLANTQTAKEWYFVHENNAQGRFMINHSDGGGVLFGLSRTGNLTVKGQLFTAGSCAAGCDRVFDEDYPLPTIAEQAALMKANKHLPNVGPTPEDGPFNLTAMTGGMLNELEKAHLYIGQLHEENAVQAEALASLSAEARDAKAENAALAARLAKLEALVETLAE